MNVSHANGKFRHEAGVAARILASEYGGNSHGNKANPLSELLFIICSLQTNESLYRSTYAELRSAFPTFQQMAGAPEGAIAAVIARGGLAKQKAGVIRRILSQLVKAFGKPTLAPLRSMSDAECETFLLSLPGVGKKTARCVMMYSLGREVFPVDSNCWRICRRLGWFKATRPDKSCSGSDMDRVQASIDPAVRFSLHVGFVSHGRRICTPQSPKCGECCLQSICRHQAKRH